ncbi:T9SS type A sorting domain-containing protein [Rufibacter latericius]|uniref:T9SS C-terminal target domain-containing protein n=1 Tax=Rufibacter latericius TaxID=2487040 RepID=A0A3M9MU12_9BACT|nr:T9SS type A sorting domain-containing protein [Rufibacter latericius]RNI29012.1 T9SS C-terminal target domain-containing protein [Rufibacter latericius]
MKGFSSVTIDSAPLPVTLQQFTATQTSNGIELTWSTASEKDNDYFQIERGVDGRNFTSLGQVKGKGTSNVAQNYRFTDTSAPSGSVYYRLKQVDLDGKFEYSKVVSVQGTGNQATAQVEVSPNPFTRVISFSVTSSEDRTLLVELFDLNQKLIYKEMVNVSSGKVTLTKDLSRIADGVYILRVTGYSLSEVIRVVKKD